MIAQAGVLTVSKWKPRSLSGGWCYLLWQPLGVSYCVLCGHILRYTISRGLILTDQQGFSTTAGLPLSLIFTQDLTLKTWVRAPQAEISLSKNSPREVCTESLWFVEESCEPYHICWSPFMINLCQPPEHNNTACSSAPLRTHHTRPLIDELHAEQGGSIRTMSSFTTSNSWTTLSRTRLQTAVSASCFVVWCKSPRGSRTPAHSSLSIWRSRMENVAFLSPEFAYA